MEKSFNPSKFEADIYNRWMEKGYFKADENSSKQPFTIVMPPPNITSKLHIGHAYGISIMDSIIRYKRMQGFEALLLPGTDHAALATEVKVVERLASQGIKKEDIGREAFQLEMQKWYDEFGGLIISQFKKVGISCDWDRLAFTLDEPRCKSVRKSFYDLYHKGLIYQGSRITNWCTTCKTALSDIEVDYQNDKGHIWHIKYPIENSDKFIVVATTRPETMFGDVAVAVNPKDKRYKKLIGTNVILPVVNKPIPIIADSYVDIKFGTGMVKITPAHDPNDYEIGKRHNLPLINVMNLDGTMNENAGKYEGMVNLDCREKLVEELTSLGYMEKIENYSHNVGHCQRCHNTLEPIVTKQWYVKMESLAKRAIEKVKDGTIKFHPKRFEKIYFHWMENIKDWCISRQLWSGHRIPVFTCDKCGEQIVELEDPTVCPKCGSNHLSQDPDSLDTWFSSALWPFSTLGWPENTKSMEKFYPTDLMVTAYDIIFFWVARMIFSGLEYTDKEPFKDILIHGIIRDELGRKMSKSLGNGIDPIDLINKYGTDSMRFSLLNGTSIGMDSRFSYDKAENASNFINKLWNASRFVTENVAKTNFEVKPLTELKLSLADKWILTELNQTINTITKLYDKFDIGMVCGEIYDFIWTKYCDWYIEASKPSLYAEGEEQLTTLNVLVYVLDKILKMLHPVMPFVTETIYQELPNHIESIMISEFPKVNKELNFASAHKVMNEVMIVVRNIRNVRKEMNVADNVRTNLFVETSNKEIKANLEIVKKLASGKEIELIANGSDLENCTMVVNDLLKVYIPNGDMVDPVKELERLNAELDKTNSEIARAEKMLNNPGFVARAPQTLVDAEKAKIVKYSEIKQNLEAAIQKLSK
ncbi:MAG: valine--tRNA ligase [Clostridia bacterium]|nr:valine--tRNA ligase [Clostridia bacterium]